MKEIPPTFRCPFCHELALPHAGGADVSMDETNFYKESQYEYRCGQGHRFSRIEMVTGAKVAGERSVA